MKKIAIMQPTYLPWLGYFGLMAHVDEFVFLDDVQFARRSWQQRNRIKGPAGPMMLTIPVLKKGRRSQLIKDVEIDWPSGFDRKHLRAIELIYSNAPYWQTYVQSIRELFSKPNHCLAEYTIAIICQLNVLLGIRTPLLRSSDLPVVGMKEDRLVDICKVRAASVYVSAPGSQSYLEGTDAFASAGIDLVYAQYNHPAYAQMHGEFVSHMSVIDVLLNCGPKSGDMVRKSVTSCAPNLLKTGPSCDA